MRLNLNQESGILERRATVIDSSIHLIFLFELLCLNLQMYSFSLKYIEFLVNANRTRLQNKV